MRLTMKRFLSWLPSRRGSLRAVVLGVAVAGACAASALAAGEDCSKKAPEPKASDYPTTAVADYVFGCMAANGESREALFHCSCSFDVMASILPYSKYEQAETILSVGQQGGPGTDILRSNPQLKEVVAEMRRAQAEAEVRCF
jgi:hypothetical protein